eukprot:TRINITY_DN1020_c0_g1_i1.p1 TRINITY_DN1020_c0_g1~~TRINITY_DN1020_c0_g1_i1.p1  ORF type:complete len:308 (+),score=72.50 TRINITY_DN1020_c0_g1_i1:45-968(+)
MSVDIRLKRTDRTYFPGETVYGFIVVTSKGPIQHSGITLSLDASVTMQLSAKSVGLFEAFYNSLKPVQLMQFNLEIAAPGKLPDGVTELPFEFSLKPIEGVSLYETYHGVFVNIQYVLTVDMQRPLLAKNLKKQLEFILQVESTDIPKPTPVDFNITPQSLENVRKSSSESIPQFKISGRLASASCSIEDPFVGEITIETSSTPIKSVEIQLVRVETCGSADGFAKEATEIQNIQVGDGDVCQGLTIPLHMLFPRLFTCPTLATRNFKIEFEVNVVVLLVTGHLITENFPIKIYRRPRAPPPKSGKA